MEVEGLRPVFSEGFKTSSGQRHLLSMKDVMVLAGVRNNALGVTIGQNRLKPEDVPIVRNTLDKAMICIVQVINVDYLMSKENRTPKYLVKRYMTC